MTNPSESRFPLHANDYELFEEIGDGVYRSRCTVLDEIVSVKILDLEKCNDDVETIRKEGHCSFLDGSSFWIVMPIGEEDLASDNSDKLEKENNEVMTSDSLVNPLSSDADQILPMLQNLLLNNEIQRKRIIGLIQLCDPTAADNVNPLVNTEAEQISKETFLSSEVDLLQQSVEKLEEEIENQKKANAQLEDQICRLTKSSHP